MTLLTFWQLSHLFAPFFTHYFRKESQIAESIKKQINLGLGNLYLGCLNGICVQAQWRWSFWLSYFYAWWELGINNPSFHSVLCKSLASSIILKKYFIGKWDRCLLKSPNNLNNPNNLTFMALDSERKPGNPHRVHSPCVGSKFNVPSILFVFY